MLQIFEILLKNNMKYDENNQEDFDNFCNYIIENPDAFKNPKLKKN